jgi:hypothetical protein
MAALVLSGQGLPVAFVGDWLGGQDCLLFD